MRLSTRIVRFSGHRSAWPSVAARVRQVLAAALGVGVLGPGLALAAGCAPGLIDPLSAKKQGEEVAPLDDVGSEIGDEWKVTSVDEVISEYTPCGNKSCGDTCTMCEPGSDDCAEVLVLRQCDPKGECVLAPAACR